MTRDYVPFLFSEPMRSSGPRFGGAPPLGVVPSCAEAAYLGTVPILGEAHQEVSLFLACDFDFILEHRGEILDDSSVEVKRHALSVRDESRPGFYQSYDLDLRGAAKDGDGDEVFDHHKLGGLPYLIHPYAEDLGSKVAKLLEVGYNQILQLDFPAGRGNCLVRGTWPFGDGMFHLLGKKPFDANPWKWFWEIQ